MSETPKPAEKPKPARKPGRWRRRLIWALCVFIALVLALRVSVSILLPAVLNKIAKSYDLACDYDRLDLNMLGGNASIWGLRFTPREGGDPIFSADYCQGDISILKLFRGRLVVYRVAADGVDTTIERTADGRIPLLARFTSSASPPPQATATSSQPQPIELQPPLRIDALRLEHIRAWFHDEFVKPEVDTHMALDLRVNDLGTTGEPTRFELDFSSTPILDTLQIYGRGNGDGKSLSADLHVVMRGLHPKPVAGYLAQVGLRPTADDISASIDGTLSAQANPNAADGLKGSLTLTGGLITCDGRTAAALDRLSLDADSITPGSAKLASLGISGVRVFAGQNQAGNLAALGMEVVPTTQPATPSASPVASPSPSNFRWSLAQFTLEDLHAGFGDDSVSPPVSTGLDVQHLKLGNLVCDPANPNAQTDFSADLSAPGIVRSIRVRGHAQPFSATRPFLVSVDAAGIAPDAIAPYLKAAGLESEWKNGSLSLSADGTVQTDKNGTPTASAHLAKFTLADQEKLLDIGDTSITGATLEPATNTIHIGAIEINGPTVAAWRDSDANVHLLGFKTTTQPSQAVASQAPPTAQSAATGAILPNIELDHFAWRNIRVNVSDAAVRPPTSIDISDAGLTADNIGIYLNGFPHTDRHGTIKGWLSVPGVASNAELEGTIDAVNTQTSVALNLSADGISGDTIAPYLRAADVRPTWKDASLSLHTRVDVGYKNGAVNASVSAADVKFSDGDQTLASLGSFGVKNAQAQPTGVSADSIEIDSPRIRAERLADGTLEVAGVRIVPVPPPPAAPLAATTRPAAPSATALTLDLGEFRLKNAALDWSDAFVRPAVNIAPTLDADIQNFHLGGSAPASLQISAAIPGTLDTLSAKGTLALSLDRQSLSLSVLGNGIRAGPAAAYLPPGINSTLKNGALRAAIDFSGMPNPAGGQTLEARVSAMDFREQGSASSLVDFDSFHVKVARLDPSAKVVALDDVTLKNLDGGARKTADGIEFLGLKITPVNSSTAAADPPPATANAPPTATRPNGNILAQIAQQRNKYPLISLTSLDLGIRHFDYLDETTPSAAPLVVSDLHVRNKHKIILLGRDTEANPPTDLEITGHVAPVADDLKVDLHATPFAKQKTLGVEISVSGIHGKGLVALQPQLASKIYADGLKSGQLTAAFNAALTLKTVEPTDFDLGYGGKLDFDAHDIAFRAEPGGPVLAGVGEIRSEGIVIKPDSAGMEARELEIDNIVGQAMRDNDGIHALGLTIKTPPPATTQPAGKSVAAASDPPPTAAARQAAKSEIKIDRLLVSGMNFRFQDRTATPTFDFPINGLDLEAQGLSNLAVSEPIPIRYSLLVSADRVPLPSQQAGFEKLENRQLFSQVTSDGDVTLYPNLKGWAKASLNGFELTSLYGIAEQEKVKLGGGTFDADIDARFPGDGSVDSSTKLVLTDLSLSEPPDGIIRRTLKLPAPLDVVIIALQDQDGSITIPLNVVFAQGNLDTGAVAASGVGALGEIIATALASSPLKVVNLIGLGGPHANAQPPVVVSFPPGYSDLLPDEVAVLNALVKRLKDDKSLDVTLRHDLGSADIALVSQRSNPTSDDALALANDLNLQRDQLMAARLSASSDVRAFTASDDAASAERARQRLRTINSQLAQTEDSLDHIYDLLRAGADRQALRRTRFAGLTIARARLEAVRRYLLAAGGKHLAPERIHLANPQFNPSAPDQPGRVTIVVVKSK
jgi:hypothetical protein